MNSSLYRRGFFPTPTIHTNLRTLGELTGVKVDVSGLALLGSAIWKTVQHDRNFDFDLSKLFHGGRSAWKRLDNMGLIDGGFVVEAEMGYHLVLEKHSCIYA